MKRLKKMFIAVEEQIRPVCPRSNLYAAWCRGCRAETEMVTFAEAADIICTDINKVVEQTAGGEVHLGIRPEAMLVCLNSLLHNNRKKNSLEAMFGKTEILN
jgi:ribosomal protein S27E